MKKNWRKILDVAGLIVMALLLAAGPSFSQTVDFSALAPAGFYGGSLSTTFITDPTTGLVATGYYKPGVGNWTPTTLWARNVEADRGLGVCNPGETDCSSSGESDELSNQVNPELIVLTLPPGYKWVQVWISSLDNNGGVAPVERGQLWASGAIPTNQSPGALGGTVLIQFAGDGSSQGPASPFASNPETNGYVVNIPAANATSPYLIFEPFDWVNAGANPDNDYLVWKAVIEKTLVGCTLTFGYWKTHSIYGPAAHPDLTWDLILPSGPDTAFFSSGKSWLQVLQTNPARGNAYYILAHQWIAAVLNIFSGASSTPAVDAALVFGFNFFSTHTPNQALTSTQRDQVISAADLLDDYNEGVIGPGHCPE